MREGEEPKLRLKNFFVDRVNIFFLLTGIVLNIILWLYLSWKIKPTNELISLHYNIYFGIDLIGEWYRIYILSLSGLIIYFINLVLSFILYKRGRIISYVILTMTLFLQIILLIAAIFIVKQNV